MSINESAKAFVLLVDDDPDDQQLTQIAFERAKLNGELRIASSGEDALNYLRRRGEYQDPNKAPRPDLIMLDLNMPRMDGKEVLREIRQDADLRSIPVVIFTTSNYHIDVAEAYDLGCNSYLQKPLDISQLTATMQDLAHYWFHVVKRPTEG